MFDPAPPSGARHGGLATAHVIEPELDRFVREVLQNARDQRVDDELVRVNFTLHRLYGEFKDRLLDGIGWDQLEPHLQAAAEEGGVTIGPQLETALRLAEDRPLLILRIDDSGTQGLTGDEDEPGGNFNALTRNTLVTRENGRYRGGSFGLGKSVLWRFSSLSTVLFSSRVREGTGWRFRLFGRTELPFHETDEGGCWAGPGWYGLEEGTDNGQRRAVSVRDERAEDLAQKIFLDRPARLGTGTTMLVIGFFEPSQECPRRMEEVADELIRSTTRWFWPSLDPVRPALQVSARVYENDLEVYSQTAELDPDVEPFQEARTHRELDAMVSTPGDVAERTLVFRVPARLDEASGIDREVDAHLTLRLRLAGTGDSPSLQNHVALVRGSGMVIRYRPVRMPFGDQPYHAVLCAGLGRGSSEADRAMEEFLRSAEPPSHNDWTHATDRLRAEYRQGTRRRLTDLWRELEEAISGICEEQPAETEEGPSRLAQLFPMSGQGGGSHSRRSRFRIERLEAWLEDSTWNLKGRVRRIIDDGTPWSFAVTARLDAETGRGRIIPVVHLQTDYGEAGEANHGWRCDVPARVSRVDFVGRAVDEGLNLVDLHRTGLRMRVHARSMDGR